MNNELQNCLEYCKQQNGLPHCKNCGLNQEMIDQVLAEQREELLKEMADAIEMSKQGWILEGERKASRAYNKAIQDLLIKLKEK